MTYNDEIKLKIWEGHIDECMHECSVWLSSIVSEYSDRCILDITVSFTDGKWLITVYYRL